MSARTPNRLAREKSPYLLQHAHNPVDWYPWGEEAFAAARAADRPIFLSIGYSTCHWCHVMERESFEDPRVAELLNRDFVPVKLDREERPDVDRVYMSAMQALGSGGGWPLNVFLTPSLKPFYGGTYFPPETRHGRPGLLQVLARVSEVWREQRERIEATGDQVIVALQPALPAEAAPAGRREMAELCLRQLAASHDPVHGGFGSAPKFPTAANLVFLLGHRGSDAEATAVARAMALRQLDAMRAGGIHDHLGGGFHRYATDAGWRVPHFEKMLYDQAQLAAAYLEAHRISGRAEHAAAARGIFDYVRRDLAAPEGAFHSAEDADSEGVEGRFYVWTPEQTAAALGADDAALFDLRYGVTARGNFEDGASILHEARSIEDIAAAAGRPAAEVRERLDRARARLLAARSTRPRPHRDDKVLAAWNGLMISALARGARALGDPALAAAAGRAAAFVWERMRDAEGGLYRRWRDGEAGHPGQLDDHAYLALGFVDLYEAVHEPEWLARAARIAEILVERFRDDAEGGFFDSPAGDPHLGVRMKDDFDGAEMAGNSIALTVLLALGHLLGRDDFRREAERTLDHYARRLARFPSAMPALVAAMETAEAPPRHVVVAGDPAAADARALIDAFDRRRRPGDRLLVVPPDERGERLAALAPWVRGLGMRDGRATGYLCVDYTCRLPATDPETFASQLGPGPAEDLAAAGPTAGTGSRSTNA